MSNGSEKLFIAGAGLKDVVLHTKLNVNAREFHVYTGSVVDRSMVLSEIFERGKFIGAKEVPFRQRLHGPTNTDVNFLKEVASDLHKSTLEEINMLFYIQTKIKPLNIFLPHYKLGTLFYFRNILNEAINCLKKTIELNIEYIPAYILLAKSYIKLGDYRNAIDILLAGYRINSEFPDLANTLGVALTFNKEYQKATSILQQALKKNPDFDEANLNLGVALFRSTIADSDEYETAVVPSRVIRYIKALRLLERYHDPDWQGKLERTLEIIDTGILNEILDALYELQLKIVTHLKIDPLIESFYLKFMYGGKELEYSELQSYENRILKLADQRDKFADYWNEMGTIHMIQCRHLFLKAVDEFDKAVELNNQYREARKNADLVKNIKKGFLILLRAILK